MKRGQPLSRQGPAIKRKRAVSRKSKAAGTYKQELDAMRPLVEVRAGYLCEVCRAHGVEVIHHRKRRSQGGTNSLANLLGLCRKDHDEIHANPRESYAWGLMLRRDDLEVPYESRSAK